MNQVASDNIQRHTLETKQMANTTKKSSIERMLEEIEKINNPVKQERPKDERYWKPTIDKAGSGSAVIRFLPAPDVDGDDALPWARYCDHGVMGPTGKWYIEKSLKSIGKPDPVYEKNAQLYNESQDPESAARKQAAAQKRRLHYVSNILVVSDPKNPEAEGKVFLFKYGKKIFDKIVSLLKPEFEGEEPIDAFDPVKGCNFKLRQKKVSGFPNYDDSKFDNPSPLASSEAEIKKITNRGYSLTEILDPKNFKTYEELKAHLTAVLGEDSDPGDFKPSVPRAKIATKKVAVEDVPFDISEDEDEDLKQFKALAAD